MNQKFVTLGFISLGLILMSLSALSEEKSDSAPKTEDKNSAQSVTEGKTEAKAEDKIAEAKPVRMKKSSQGCLADEEIIEDLRKRKESVETRLKDVEKRESEITAKERALDEEMKKLTVLRDEITGVQMVQAKAQEEKVAKLVETFETMTPKAIAAMLNSLDERLAVEAMSKVSTQKLAKIMNIMEPGRSSRLSELLAGVARARGSIPKSNDLAAATQLKGGENNGSNPNNPNNDQSAGSSGKRQPASESAGQKSESPAGK